MLTHNRDEDVARITSDHLITKEFDGVEATFPMDIQSQGTWVLTSKTWTTAILNGGFELHNRKPPYRHSRGLLPFMLLKYSSTSNFVNDLNLDQIEPFTQVFLHHTTQDLSVLVWDGEQKHFNKIKVNELVLSSSTLYNHEEKERHKSLIKSINKPTPAELSYIHQSLSWRHNPDLPMLKTTSQVQVLSDYKNKSMKFTKFVKS